MTETKVFSGFSLTEIQTQISVIEKQGYKVICYSIERPVPGKVPEINALVTFELVRVK